MEILPATITISVDEATQEIPLQIEYWDNQFRAWAKNEDGWIDLWPLLPESIQAQIERMYEVRTNEAL